MTTALADCLQVWGFESGSIIFSDGTLGVGLEASPIDVSCWDDVKVDNLAGGLASFLNSVPAGTDLQFIQEIGKGNGYVINRNKSLATGYADSTR